MPRVACRAHGSTFGTFAVIRDETCAEEPWVGNLMEGDDFDDVCTGSAASTAPAMGTVGVLLLGAAIQLWR